MSEKQRDRLLPALLILVILTGIVLSAGLIWRERTMAAELNGLETQLNTAKDEIRRISTEKETMQDELTETNNSIREAELTLQESGAKCEEIRGQLAELAEHQPLVDAAVAEAESAYAALAEAQQKLHSAVAALETALRTLKADEESGAADRTAADRELAAEAAEAVRLSVEELCSLNSAGEAAEGTSEEASE